MIKNKIKETYFLGNIGHLCTGFEKTVTEKKRNDKFFFKNGEQKITALVPTNTISKSMQLKE